MNQTRKWFATLCLMLATTMAWAQGTVTVSGQVTDPSNEPLIGVTVMIDGQTAGGTVTDFDGNYTIKATKNATLKFSYIGYQDQKIPVAGKTVVNVQMKEDAELLEEVVVVGFGTTKKESLTGAVTVVDAKAFEGKGSLSSPLEALQGQVAGVMITRSSSAPGEEGWDMKLRGSVSKNSGGPLVIIDGVAGDMGSVNSADIESINFLKDGSAAIYGSRAADGVVIITTKKGKEGKVKINYSGSVTIKSPGLQPELMSLTEWADGLMTTLENDQNTSNVWYTYAQKNQTGYKARVDYDEYFNYKNGFHASFLFGTNQHGQDIITCLAVGARFSLILAICVASINFVLGIIYGSIEGYYGGATDMIMERISDVLGYMPFIVVATLFKLHLQDTVGPVVALLFAFVLTGWIP
ncbi:MAG: carboxypeptidase-like regulatory domain-containing protein, partial [Prevotella sp.]|nr:carboxypeptidase-like regulatory domain-containing protein [Prevotella sp.]